MKIYVYPGDRWGCGSYRLRWPGEAVAAAGELDVTVVDPGDRQLELHVQAGRVLKETFPEDADVVVLQRPHISVLAQTVPMLRQRGVAVVVDMDDDLSRIHPSNPAFARLQPTVRGPNGRRFRNTNSWHNAAQACRDATLVTVTTPALAGRYGSHGRVRVLPNMIPEWYLTIPHEDSDVIGWAGTVATHPDDLQAVGPAIAVLIQQGAEFRQVGGGGGVARALGLREEPPTAGDVELHEWPVLMAEFGIGIAPLADTQFNAAKSRLKPLEMAAVGVPWVGSPMPDYVDLHKQGTGQIAVRPKDWARLLRRLRADPALRVELSEAGRAVAAANTIEGNAWRWAEAWADAARMQRSAVAAA
jgi:hypothetical protein